MKSKHTEGNTIHKPQDFEKYLTPDPPKRKNHWPEPDSFTESLNGLGVILGSMTLGAIVLILISWAFGLFDLHK
jgi:hypothetical protein